MEHYTANVLRKNTVFCAFVGLGSGYCKGSLQVSVSVVFVVSVKSTSANQLVIMNKFFRLRFKYKKRLLANSNCHD